MHTHFVEKTFLLNQYLQIILSIFDIFWWFFDGTIWNNHAETTHTPCRKQQFGCTHEYHSIPMNTYEELWLKCFCFSCVWFLFFTKRVFGNSKRSLWNSKRSPKILYKMTPGDFQVPKNMTTILIILIYFDRCFLANGATLQNEYFQFPQLVSHYKMACASYVGLNIPNLYKHTCGCTPGSSTKCPFTTPRGKLAGGWFPGNK